MMCTDDNQSDPTRPEISQVVARDSMKGITKMRVDGDMRNLGMVKNFKDQPQLRKYLPHNLAISWAHLDPFEELRRHRHPVASMIVAIEGAGTSTGDSNKDFVAGDVLYIPPWNEHGFIGARDTGLWALSIQYNDIAIFENEIDPLTSFKDTLQVLPSLEDRQIDIISRDHLNGGKSFAANPGLQALIPNEFEFSWISVEGSHFLALPESRKKRLLVVCQGRGFLKGRSSRIVTKGDAFWQEEDLHISTSAHKNIWLLSIVVEEGR